MNKSITKKIQRTLFCLILLAQALESTAQVQQGYPSKGYLMLLGGGITPQQARLFMKYAGGPEQKILVVPTAFADSKIKRDPNFVKVKKRFKKLGMVNVEILHTRDRDLANTSEFAQKITQVNGVFFLGGKTARLTDAYANTAVHRALLKLLARGGIIGGVSAGSGAQANYFFQDKVQNGFGFLPDVIVMNHFLSRNKQFRHTQALRRLPKYIGIGIDDNTGVFIENGVFEVIGQSYVAMYDGTNYLKSKDSIARLPIGSERFYLLRNGDRYSLTKRQVSCSRLVAPTLR